MYIICLIALYMVGQIQIQNFTSLSTTDINTDICIYIMHRKGKESKEKQAARSSYSTLSDILYYIIIYCTALYIQESIDAHVGLVFVFMKLI